MKKYTLLLVVLFLVGCGNNSNDKPIKSQDESKSPQQNSSTQSNTSVKKNRSSNGSDKVSYDVVGYDKNGNELYGNIEVRNNDGTGYVIDDEEFLEVSEGFDGRVEVTDKNGDSYELDPE